MFELPVDVVVEIRRLADDLETMSAESRSAVAHSRLLALAHRFRAKDMDGNAALDSELRDILPNAMAAYKHCRAKLGCSLIEAKDYVERLRGAGAC